MECPHFPLTVTIENALRKENTDVTKEWQCAVCSTSQSPWLCLHCGAVNCGRYIKGHAKEHFEKYENHSVCMDCNTLAVFCYTCDEFVVNDTQCRLLERIRQGWFQAGANKFESSNTVENECPVNEDVSGIWKSDSLTKEIQENVRNLRPRSRKRKIWYNIQCGFVLDECII